MKTLLAPHAKAEPPIRWNDLEALPIYAAMALGLLCLFLALADRTPTIYAFTAKAVGIMGSLALRHAWLKLDDEGAGPELV